MPERLQAVWGISPIRVEQHVQFGESPVKIRHCAATVKKGLAQSVLITPFKSECLSEAFVLCQTRDARVGVNAKFGMFASIRTDGLRCYGSGF